ncbi:PqqD family protein [Krasilnikovia sp. MM14-A1259]|uniref:PqqD family protein n=1 Tax=Krasilnikovia sp. MM14-A1259 TaxID=3373539 RepID=UPI0038006E2A
MSLHISDSVIWHETAEGISLYHTESGEFRTLNGSAAKIWVLVESDQEREPVKDKLALMFAGGNAAMGARIRSEVDTFIDSMVGSGLLAEGEPAAAA